MMNEWNWDQLRCEVREKKREQFALAHAVVPRVMDCLKGWPKMKIVDHGLMGCHWSKSGCDGDDDVDISDASPNGEIIGPHGQDLRYDDVADVGTLLTIIVALPLYSQLTISWNPEFLFWPEKQHHSLPESFPLGWAPFLSAIEKINGKNKA